MIPSWNKLIENFRLHGKNQDDYYFFCGCYSISQSKITAYTNQSIPQRLTIVLVKKMNKDNLQKTKGRIAVFLIPRLSFSEKVQCLERLLQILNTDSSSAENFIDFLNKKIGHKVANNKQWTELYSWVNEHWESLKEWKEILAQSRINQRRR